ncbi:MAG TPA: class I SAM-dependent methyltransferase, partial [Gemmatimonadales bacterium]|nr:class I SAM-dependent methyltransferase [Gemmatimonadales bacterium]
MTDPFRVRDYWESRLRQSYSLQGVGYQRLGTQYNKWMYRLRARVFQRVARGLGVDWPAARVLDVGSGTGFYVDQWHQLGVPKVTGVDITSVAVQELARRFPRDEFVQLDVGKKLANDSRLVTRDYAAVSAKDVLFHIVDDAEYQEAFRNMAS